MTTMTTMTKQDAIGAAMDVADDVAQGRVNPADLEARAVSECRALFGTVAGPDDLLWPLHVEVARGVLAADGIPVDELSEWLAVSRRRAGDLLDPDETPPQQVSSLSVAHSPEQAVSDSDADPEDEDLAGIPLEVLVEAEAAAEAAAQAVIDRFRQADGQPPFGYLGSDG